MTTIAGFSIILVACCICTLILGIIPGPVGVLVALAVMILLTRIFQGLFDYPQSN